MGKYYVYCDSHGAVHVSEDGTEVWCTAAQNGGMDLRYVKHMQEYAQWTDQESLDFAREYCKDHSLWLYEPKNDWQ